MPRPIPPPVSRRIEFRLPVSASFIAWIPDVTYQFRGFVSTVRANPLAKKIVAADIALGLNDFFTFYTGDNC